MKKNIILFVGLIIVCGSIIIYSFYKPIAFSNYCIDINDIKSIEILGIESVYIKNKDDIEVVIDFINSLPLYDMKWRKRPNSSPDNSIIFRNEYDEVVYYLGCYYNGINDQITFDSYYVKPIHMKKLRGLIVDKES